MNQAQQTPTQYLKVANDLGNGRVKAAINDAEIQMPSIMAVQRSQDLYDPDKFATEAQREMYVASLLDNLDVSIQSPAVKESGRLLVGKSATKLSTSAQGFDVNDLSGKSEKDLPLILTLSSIAGYAVIQQYYQDKKLPTRIDVTVDMAVALPINEGSRDGAADAYAERYTNHRHIVTLHNFAELIQVEITFRMVEVALEGEAAQYQLRYASDALANAVKADYDKYYPELAADPEFPMSAKDLTSLPNVIGIDIGEGTVDIPVFIDGALQIKTSTSDTNGYGNALEEAVRELRSNSFNVANRNALQNIVLTKQKSPTGLQRQKDAQRAVDNQLRALSDSITNVASGVLKKVSSSIDIIFVYGGGATPMAPYLRRQLMEKTKAFTANYGIPVVFVPEEYAQTLNQKGLSRILDVMVGSEGVVNG